MDLGAHLSHGRSTSVPPAVAGRTMSFIDVSTALRPANAGAAARPTIATIARRIQGFALFMASLRKAYSSEIGIGAERRAGIARSAAVATGAAGDHESTLFVVGFRIAR